MANEQEQQQVGAPVRSDIGWKQFVIGIFELVRWPIAVVAIVLFLHLPLERLLNSLSLALRD